MTVTGGHGIPPELELNSAAEALPFEVRRPLLLLLLVSGVRRIFQPIFGVSDHDLDVAVILVLDAIHGVRCAAVYFGVSSLLGRSV